MTGDSHSSGPDQTGEHWGLALQARHLQTYILQHSRMREMVGASAMIAAISAVFPDALMDSLGLQKGDWELARSGAGAFEILLTDQNIAERAAAALSLFVPQFAPGLVFSIRLAQGKNPADALKNLQSKMRATMPPRLDLPLASPFAQRAIRSARAANHWRRDGDEDKPLDHQALCKQIYAKAQQTNTQNNTASQHSLEGKFAADSRYPWPLDLNPAEAEADTEAQDQPSNPAANQAASIESTTSASPSFPFDAERHYLALLHIDGNSMGKVLQSLRETLAGREDFAQVWGAFSRLIDEVAQSAAQSATTAHLLPMAEKFGVYPARPLVLGGDDMSILLRADLALDFATCFMQSFEKKSAELLDTFCTNHQIERKHLPTHFSACGGLVWMRAKQSFYHAYEVCEELCLRAKDVVKALGQTNADASAPTNDSAPSPSALAFMRLTSQQSAQAGMRDGSLLGVQQSLGVLGNVYGVTANSPGLPPLAKLQQACACLSQPSQNIARSALQEIHLSLSQIGDRESLQLAQKRYQRWQKIIKEDSNADSQQLQTLLAACGDVLPHTKLPIYENGAQIFSPLGDLLALHAHNAEQGASEENTCKN